MRDGYGLDPITITITLWVIEAGVWLLVRWWRRRRDRRWHRQVIRRGYQSMRGG